MKEYLIGFLGAWAVFGLGYIWYNSALPLFGRKRVTSITRNGQRIRNMGIAKVLGFSLSKAQIEEAEDIFIDVFWREFGTAEIRQYFANNEIIYRPHPIPMKSYPTGFVNAYHKANQIFLGVLPWVDKTALAHEWVHDMLQEKTGDPDQDYTSSCWPMVDVVNDKIRERRQNEEKAKT